MSGGKNLIDKNPQSGDEGKPTENETERTTPITRTTVDIPDAIKKEICAYRKETQRDSHINRYIAIAAVAGAWIYAAIAVLQWYQMRESNHLTKVAQGQTEKTVADANRPWLGVDKITISNFVVGQHPIVNLTSLNSGKGPALNATQIENIALVGRGHPDKPPLYIPPISPIFKPEEFGRTTVFPNSTISSITTTSWTLDQEIWDGMKSGKIWVIVLVWLTYEDSIKRAHHSRTCEYYNVSDGSFEVCTNGNYAD